MELNANEIIKALEVCGEYTHGTTCNSCPYMHIELADNEICSNRLSQDALALIKQLTEEVADWKAIAEGYQKKFEDCAEDRARLTDENVEIGIENFDLICELSRIKENTVREMQERLKKELAQVMVLRDIHDEEECNLDSDDVWEVIDRVAKEVQGL